MITFLVLAVVLGATLAVALFPSRKEATALAAAALLMTLGQVLGFFQADKALGSVSLAVLVILLAVGIFASVFAASGAFQSLCLWIAVRTRGDRRVLIPLFLVLTYLLSALLPNLTCLYVLLPLMIGALRAVGLSPDSLRRVVVSLVIASNLGGASTMIGDFPNILISRSQSIPFVSFLLWMTPACLLLLALLLVLMFRKEDYAQGRRFERLVLVQMLDQQRRALSVDRRLLIPASATFFLMLCGLLFTGWFPFPPEIVCLAAACLCVFLLPRPEHWVTQLDVRSTLFIACLFLFAGAIQATGALDRVAQVLLAFAKGDPRTLSAALIVLGFVFTAVFSAGPTTAVLIPIAAALKPELPGDLVWWCLSLGVLAGSSTTLLSATAGPIAANQLREHAGLELTYANFLGLGLRSGLVFCVGSIVYIWWRLD